MSYTRAPCIEAVQATVRRHYCLVERCCRNRRRSSSRLPRRSGSWPRPPAAVPAAPRAFLCTLEPGQARLDAGTLHGLAQHLPQYPDLSLASVGQRRAAALLLRRIREATARWRAVEAAASSGFATHLAKREPGDVFVGYLHAEHRRFSADRRLLDPRRPEALIYARSRADAQARRSDVQRSPWRARTDARWADRSLACPCRLREGRQARARPAPRRDAAQRGNESAGERDAARVAYLRPAERLRRPCARSRALP